MLYDHLKPIHIGMDFNSNCLTMFHEDFKRLLEENDNQQSIKILDTGAQTGTHSKWRDFLDVLLQLPVYGTVNINKL